MGGRGQRSGRREMTEGAKRKAYETPHIRFPEPSCAGTWQNNREALLNRSNGSSLHAALFLFCFCCGE